MSNRVPKRVVTLFATLLGLFFPAFVVAQPDDLGVSLAESRAVNIVEDAKMAGRVLTPIPADGVVRFTPGIGVVAVHGIGKTQTMIANGVFGVGAILSFLYCLITAIKQRQLYPLFVFAGACVAVPIEIFVDILGRCNWATQDQPIIGTIMGREVPLLILINYMVYFPGAVVAVHNALDKGMTLRGWWTFAAISIPLAWIFELYPVHAKWWYYYGEGQPLALHGLPMWWGPAAMLAVMGAAALTFVIRRDILRSRHAWFLVFAIPLGVVSIHMTSSFPVLVALSSTENPLITNAAAIFSVAMAFAMLHLIGLFVTRSNLNREVRAESAAVGKPT
jgi:hypothetical protein